MKAEDTYCRSSFPLILDSHLSPVKAANQEKSKKMRIQQSSGVKGQVAVYTASAVDSDQMIENKRKALLDQRHLETYYRIHRLKDILTHQYAELLKVKVQRQRQEMKSHGPADSKITGGHKGQRHRLTVQKFSRSTLTHDDAYLKSLPKSRHYMVLELQKQLSRMGYLQSRREQEVFRVWVEQNKSMTQLENQLQAMKLGGNSGSDVRLESLLKQNSQTLPKLLISPDDITAQQEQMPVSLSGNGGGTSAPNSNSKQTWGQDETELMFPEVFTREVKVPTFPTLQSTFLETVTTKMHLVRSYEPSVRSRTTDIFRHKLRHMHKLSISHMAFSQRIMEENRLGLQCKDGFSIKDLMEYGCPYNVQTHESRCSGEPDLTHVSLRDTPPPDDPESLTESLATQIPPSLQSAEKSPEDSNSCSSANIHSSNTEVPLCIHDLYAVHSIEVENSDKMMWTNYT